MPTRTTGLMRWKTEHRYGGPTRSIDGTPTVTTTATRAANQKPDRVSLTFVNVGTVDVFMAINGAVNSLNGIRLAANGGFLNIRQDDDDTLPTEAWYAIVSSGTSQLYAIETISDTIVPPEEN